MISPRHADDAGSGLRQNQTTRVTAVRLAFRDRVADGRLMAQVVHDIKDLLLDGSDWNEDEAGHLWDERVGAVLSGRDYSDQEPTLVGITGPELPVVPVDW
jgi:CRISPR-associated protein Cas1